MSRATSPIGAADDSSSDKINDVEMHSGTSRSDSYKRKVYKGMIEFEVEPIKELVCCYLCDGLYREPYTTIKCFHTFCKSCLATALSSNLNTKMYNCCPKCELYFGRQDDLLSIALPDRTLETLLDKVLFPELAEMDAALESEFYRKRDVPRKEYPDERSGNGPRAKKHKNQGTLASKPLQAISAPSDGTVIFRLIPEIYDSGDFESRDGNSTHRASLPSMDLPFLQAQGSIRIGQLKKYLRIKLNLGFEQKQSSVAGAEPDFLVENTNLDILCNSVPLGNELSVIFVSRAVWKDPGNSGCCLTLEYRRSRRDW